MTRLRQEDIDGLGPTLAIYDTELKKMTGRSLREIACRASRVDEEKVINVIPQTSVGVISITAGEGMISGFAEAVRDIINYLGFYAFVPKVTDVAGIVKAIEQGSKVIFMADDERFVACNLSTGLIVDNAEATGRGYGAALEGLVGGLEGHSVLVIGAGLVGTGAVEILKEMGAQIGVYDRKVLRAEWMARKVEGTVERNLETALQRHSILFDASPASEIIEARHISPTTMIAAPGIPLGLTAEARLRIKGRLIHDPLQIGVAAMMISSVAMTD